jgi:hypothetical protein
MLNRYFDALRAGAGAQAAHDAAFGGVDWHALEEEWAAYLQRL